MFALGSDPQRRCPWHTPGNHNRISEERSSLETKTSPIIHQVVVRIGFYYIIMNLRTKLFSTKSRTTTSLIENLRFYPGAVLKVQFMSGHVCMCAERGH